MKKEVIKVDEVGGFSYNLYVYTLEGKKPGPTVYIQANVHGAEIQGNACIWKLVEKLKDYPIHGKIIFIPQANPYGSSVKMGTYTYGRFNPVTGDNWNRMYLDFFKLKENQGRINIEQFVSEHGHKPEADVVALYKSLIKDKVTEYREFHKDYGISENKNVFSRLQEQASQADIVLDLHTAGVGCRYLYCPEYLTEESKDFDFPFSIVIPNEFGGAMDEATFYPWVKLYDEMKKQGHEFNYKFESYTLELGGEEFISMEDAHDDSERILNYLTKKGVVNYMSNYEQDQKAFCLLENYKMYRAPHSGLCEYHFGAGEYFKKGDVLATIYRYDNLEDLDSSKHEIIALTDGALINHTPSSNVKMGMDLMECFTSIETY